MLLQLAPLHYTILCSQSEGQISPVSLTGPHGHLNQDMYACVRVFMCVVICVSLGAAGGQATWHPDVEHEVLLEAKLLFSVNGTYFL